ncbi:MAG: T9SS type A sorting domain-containing protein [Ignavibacteriales bacterium]|nr:T9SS type A sorting domain-containing protein [Ignavibacteriales bacterium]
MTTIKYSLKEKGVVNLRVFDVLGNEVTTLLNDEQQSGNYEIKYDGSSIASGIYFYQIRAGNYTETKKMVLLK